MKRAIRNISLALALLLGLGAPALAQVTLRYSTPSAHIGLNLGGYPLLERIPGYPVYYAPRLGANYFFYDGMYWVYENDDWYASSWYDGPWGLVDPFYVPDFLLRVPVRYYRHAPVYFRGWRADAPPRWHEHWGHSWAERRRGWEHWDRRQAHNPAPLPTYQREYRGSRYPDAERQARLHSERYRYQPRDEVTRHQYQEYQGSRRDERQGARREEYRRPDSPTYNREPVDATGRTPLPQGYSGG